MRNPRWVLAFLFITTFLFSVGAEAVNYDIVYVRQPRYGDDEVTLWPEVINPAELDPGADLMLLHPDGSEEVLVACSSEAGGNGKCSVTDPFVSFDGQWVYYSYFYDMTDLEHVDFTAGSLPVTGADIYRIHVGSRSVEQLTFGEFTPNLGAGKWKESNPVDPGGSFNALGYGVLNLGPCPLPGGKIAFTSNRNGFQPQRKWTATTMQLYVMDEDGSNVTPIAPMTISSALHPTVLQDGRMIFSSHEDQGLRGRRLWGIWSIYPDGRKWEPVVSAFQSAQAFHFMTQLSDGDIVVVDYYNINNSGFGAMYRLPVDGPEGAPKFHDAFDDSNPEIDRTLGDRGGNDAGTPGTFKMSFTPKGLYSITPMTHQKDHAAPLPYDGAPYSQSDGKFTQPSGAPSNDLLVVWSSGPVSEKNRPQNNPYYDSGIYIMPDGDPVSSPDEMVLIKNSPNYNEAWPRAVVPYRQIHGVDEPTEIPWLPNDGSEHVELPAGTPYGLIGTSSFYRRESFPGEGEDEYDGLDAFNKNGSSNWDYQGADAGKYSGADIWAVRILAMEPNSHRNKGPNDGKHFMSHPAERLRILGEIPLRKAGNPTDDNGNPDTSFLAKIPADTPFTFQTIDRNGSTLNMAQTWHQVRPGEVRVDCGGCHAHSKTPLDFSTTMAAEAGYEIFDLTKDVVPLLKPDANGDGDPELSWETMDSGQGVYNLEFYRDIRPILQARCTSCHTKSDPTPPGELVLDDYALRGGENNIQVPGDYWRLADDENADEGYPPVNGNDWDAQNASRYVRKLQSRRSLLTWVVFGERLDGWKNNDHPTAAIPGNAGSLPNGADPDMADLDCCPDVAEHVIPVEEAMTIARWIDLGAPINSDDADDRPFGWFLDDLRPTLTVSMPRPGLNNEPVETIRIGVADAYKGIRANSLSVAASFEVDGRAAGSELADLAVLVDDAIYEIDLGAPLSGISDGTVVAEVTDRQGNVSRVEREFSTDVTLSRLSITMIGPGSGTVTTDPAGIDCGADCESMFPNGTRVELHADAEPNSSFAGWSGDPDCLDGEVTIGGNLTCIAEFSNCPFEAHLIFTDAVVQTDQTVYACGSITVGPNVRVKAPAHLTFVAGERVIFEGVVHVDDGAKVTVENVP